MKKGVLIGLFTGLLVTIHPYFSLAAAVNETSQQSDIIQESSSQEQEGHLQEETASDLEQESITEELHIPEETTKFIIPKGEQMVETEQIDLSLHKESSGEFSPVYGYENPFLGRDTSNGVILEFYAKPNWEVHELGAIVAFCGSGDYDGRLYFSPGSYLGFNSDLFGGYFDANIYNYTLVTDYIRDGAKIRIELLPGGFSVYANDILCYDQTILSDSSAGVGDFTPESDFSSVLTWLSGAEALYFGYGSWWNTVGTNEANIDLSQVNFRLQDGTVVFDRLEVEKDVIESLGGKDDIKGQTAGEIKLEEVSVELFDINSVEYTGISVLPVMTAIVIGVAVIAVTLMVYALKKREYEDEGEIN